MERLLQLGQRNGLHLPKDTQEVRKRRRSAKARSCWRVASLRLRLCPQEIKRIKKTLSNLCIDFNKNLNEDTTSLSFSREQLGGCRDDATFGLSSCAWPSPFATFLPSLLSLGQAACRKTS